MAGDSTSLDESLDENLDDESLDESLEPPTPKRPSLDLAEDSNVTERRLCRNRPQCSPHI